MSSSVFTYFERTEGVKCEFVIEVICDVTFCFRLVFHFTQRTHARTRTLKHSAACYIGSTLKQ